MEDPAKLGFSGFGDNNALQPQLEIFKRCARPSDASFCEIDTSKYVGQLSLEVSMIEYRKDLSELGKEPYHLRHHVLGNITFDWDRMAEHVHSVHLRRTVVKAYDSVLGKSASPTYQKEFLHAETASTHRETIVNFATALIPLATVQFALSDEKIIEERVAYALDEVAVSVVCVALLLRFIMQTILRPVADFSYKVYGVGLLFVSRQRKHRYPETPDEPDRKSELGPSDPSE